MVSALPDNAPEPLKLYSAVKPYMLPVSAIVIVVALVTLAPCIVASV